MSGKKKVEMSLKTQLSSQDFAHHHSINDCDGVWGVMQSTNVPYPLDALGTVLLPIVPFVACPKCQAAFMLPGFLDLVQKNIACNLVVSDKVLSANELRFLRLTFSLKQQDVVDGIDMDSTSFYSKCETGKEPLGSDKQVRLKLFYATKLGINQADDYHKINLTSSRRDSSGETGTGSKVNLRQEEVKDLTNAFKNEYKLKDLPQKRA